MRVQETPYSLQAPILLQTHTQFHTWMLSAKIKSIWLVVWFQEQTNLTSPSTASNAELNVWETAVFCVTCHKADSSGIYWNLKTGSTAQIWHDSVSCACSSCFTHHILHKYIKFLKQKKNLFWIKKMFEGKWMNITAF